jgi:hypothetical protein
MRPNREELALAIDEAEWSWLRAHLDRGGLILVDDTLDLVDTAIKVANDDTTPIQEWVNAGKIRKPSESQIEAWDKNSQKKFAILIISPYVLIQDRLPTFH